VFQSSPARGGGCNEVSTGGTAPRWARFNPPPPVGAGATRTDGTNPPDENVSILTRPWGRVQRGANCCRCATATCFKPHPPGGAGANPPATSQYDTPYCFNPHPPVGAGATAAQERADGSVHVSILTRPWGRVQRGLENARERFPKRKCSSCQGVPCRALGG
jgi:hypothetical protein